MEGDDLIFRYEFSMQATAIERFLIQYAVEKYTGVNYITKVKTLYKLQSGQLLPLKTMNIPEPTIRQIPPIMAKSGTSPQSVIPQNTAARTPA